MRRKRTKRRIKSLKRNITDKQKFKSMKISRIEELKFNLEETFKRSSRHLGVDAKLKCTI